MGFRKTRESKLIDALQETDKEEDSLKESIKGITDKLEELDGLARQNISGGTCEILIHKATRALKMELSGEINNRLEGLRDNIERKTEQQINNIIDEIVKRKIQEIEDQILVSVVRKSMGIERK